MLKDDAVLVVASDGGEIARLAAVSWISKSKVRVDGSVNPRNCEMFDLDVETGEESNGQFGECGSFAPSPDGKHIAYRGMVPQGPDEEREDTVEVDDGKVAYGGTGKLRIRVGPIWSDDSRSVAVLEEAPGSSAVTILWLEGRADKVPITAEALGSRYLRWAGEYIVVGSGSYRLAIDRRTRQTMPLSAEIARKLERAAEGKSKSSSDAQEVVRRLGGKEGVVWP
jgi:hypothetical protein